MNEHTATELAYKNGYQACLKEFEKFAEEVRLRAEKEGIDQSCRIFFLMYLKMKERLLKNAPK